MSWASLSRNLRELRVHICNAGDGSQGTRDFIRQSYAVIKRSNPGFPFLIREAEGVQAKLIARYAHGDDRLLEPACCTHPSYGSQRRRNHEASEDLKEGTAALDALQIIQIDHGTETSVNVEGCGSREVEEHLKYLIEAGPRVNQDADVMLKQRQNQATLSKP